MKLTDLALVFIAIFLPVVVIVYVNTSFVVKSEKQEMYYKNLMNSAITDAVSSMKHIESSDQEIDYGYSGIVDKKVSVNASTAITTFYNSLANNFNIANNELSLERLKMYIPVVAVLDYDGIYIHSAEQDEAGNIAFTTKPKSYYTYNYVITKQTTGSLETEYTMVDASKINDIDSTSLASDHIYEVNFTMDDYVTLNIYEISTGKVAYSKGFYRTDDNNNKNLVYEEIYTMTSGQRVTLKNQIRDKLKEIRRETIATIGMKEISYAINKHNDYAGQVGIKYNFRFSVESDQVWYETMDGIGMIAVIQGISLGNRYLNYKAYSASDLVLAKKYYVSKGIQLQQTDLAYMAKNLYHISNKCTAYLEYLNNATDKLVPNFYSKKADAATHGYYPCPICKP